MVIIGLTGGIGTGKSTVAAMLADMGAVVLNADAVGHRAYARGTPGFDAVVAAFGPGVVGASGEIDRPALGQRVFANPAELKRLNAIVHPIIGQLVREDIERARAAGVRVLVLEAALLFEAHWDHIADVVWVTTAPPDVVEQRLAARSGLTADQVRQRMANQMPEADRRARADLVIDTNRPLPELRQLVRQAWNTLPDQSHPLSTAT